MYNLLITQPPYKKVKEQTIVCIGVNGMAVFFSKMVSINTKPCLTCSYGFLAYTSSGGFMDP